MDHPFFGSVALPDDADVVWERPVEVSGGQPLLKLWADRRTDQQALDWLAEQAQRLDELHVEARGLLLAYLEDDRSFIDVHIEEAGLDLPSEAATFVDELPLRKVALWAVTYSDEEGDQVEVVMDFMVDPRVSDEILAVKFPRDGEPYVAWES